MCERCRQNWEGYVAIVGLWPRFQALHDPGHPHLQVLTSPPRMAAVVNAPVKPSGPKDSSISMETSASPGRSTQMQYIRYDIYIRSPFDIAGAEIVFMEKGEVYDTVGRHGCAEVGCLVRANSKRLISHHVMIKSPGPRSQVLLHGFCGKGILA